MQKRLKRPICFVFDLCLLGDWSRATGWLTQYPRSAAHVVPAEGRPAGLAKVRRMLSARVIAHA